MTEEAVDNWIGHLSKQMGEQSCALYSGGVFLVMITIGIIYISPVCCAHENIFWNIT